jgi:hypothetical protein
MQRSLLNKMLAVGGGTERIVEVFRPTTAELGIKGHKQMPRLDMALTDTPTPKPPKTPTLSVPPPRVRRGSSPRFHATRDTLGTSLFALSSRTGEQLKIAMTIR